MTSRSPGGVQPGPPTPLQGRIAGAGAILGAALWLLGLGSLAAAGLGDAGDGGRSASGLVLPIAIAALLFAIALIALETRATPEVRLVDLVGDLSVAVGALIFVAATVLGSFALLGPGLLLFHLGATIFGFAGFDGRRRPRWASALIGAGAASLLAYLLLGGTLGPDAGAGLAQGAFVGVLTFSAGWAWLGLHLALGRPLAPRPAA